MTRTFAIAAATLAIGLAAAGPAAAQQYYGVPTGNGGTVFVPRSEGGYSYSYGVNPYTGTYYQRNTAVNPFTGTQTTQRSYYNPYTGQSGWRTNAYNPYTNQYRYRYGYWR